MGSLVTGRGRGAKPPAVHPRLPVRGRGVNRRFECRSRSRRGDLHGQATRRGHTRPESRLGDAPAHDESGCSFAVNARRIGASSTMRSPRIDARLRCSSAKHSTTQSTWLCV